MNSLIQRFLIFKEDEDFNKIFIDRIYISKNKWDQFLFLRISLFQASSI